MSYSFWFPWELFFTGTAVMWCFRKPTTRTIYFALFHFVSAVRALSVFREFSTVNSFSTFDRVPPVPFRVVVGFFSSVFYRTTITRRSSRIVLENGTRSLYGSLKPPRRSRCVYYYRYLVLLLLFIKLISHEKNRKKKINLL